MNPIEADPRLADLRARVARIDTEVIGLLAERVRLARAIGRIKGRAGRPVTDPEHEAAVIRRAATSARAASLDAEAVRAVFWRIIALARDAQRVPAESAE